MNIQQAKALPLSGFVGWLGGRYSHTGENKSLWYFSPFRPTEKTASFKIDAGGLTWFDFGRIDPARMKGTGGDIINLYCDFYGLSRESIAEALNGLETFALAIGSDNPLSAKIDYPEALEMKNTMPPDPAETKSPVFSERYRVTEVKKVITAPGLRSELARRRISLVVASAFVSEGRIKDTVTGKEYTGFLLKNDRDGYEISIPNPSKGKCFKTHSGQKGPSSRMQTGGREIIIFEGMFDFLTYIEMNKRRLSPHTSYYILNSVTHLNVFFAGLAACKHYGMFPIDTIYAYLDNDTTGRAANENAALWAARSSVYFVDQSYIYKDYTDLSEYWQKLQNNQITNT